MPNVLIPIAKTDEVPSGQMRIFRAGDLRVAVCQFDGAFHAIEDICTHDDGPLGEGTFCDGEVQCPRHGARFDVRTGKALSMPAVVPVRVFPVSTEDGKILIEVDETEIPAGGTG